MTRGAIEKKKKHHILIDEACWRGRAVRRGIAGGQNEKSLKTNLAWLFFSSLFLRCCCRVVAAGKQVDKLALA